MQEQEAIDYGQRALIEDRPEPVEAVPQPVRHSHQPRAEEGSPTGEEPDRDQRAAHDFDRPGAVDDELRGGLLQRTGKPEQLLGPKENEEQAAMMRMSA